jgi:metal-dependent amidase/aminoacylase/carboxypeptidase family protein
MAKNISRKSFTKGTVMLLFQPAEEDGNGAARI